MSGNNNQNQGEQQFTIQPHPATTNDPADLQRGGNNLAGGANVFNTPGIASLPDSVTQGLEQPQSREEARAKELNK